MREVEDYGNQQNKKYGELFERHEGCKGEDCDTIRGEDVCCAHYYRVGNDHFDCVFSELGFTDKKEKQNIDDTLDEECLGNDAKLRRSSNRSR